MANKAFTNLISQLRTVNGLLREQGSLMRRLQTKVSDNTSRKLEKEIRRHV